MSSEHLKILLGMLDDPDENSAVSVMGELLRSNSSELLPLLGDLQESNDPLMRKRIHELQSIIALRNRRKRFLELLESDEFDVFEALIELHLLWFDRDTTDVLQEMLQTFMSVAANNQIRNIAELGAFMMRNNFALPPEDEAMDPENFCIGPVLEDRLGSDVILCTLALLAGLDAGLELGLVHLAGGFAVINAAGEMISPANGWMPDQVVKLQGGDFWNDPRMVFKYASLMLFLYAGSSDNFRYIHTIGHALCNADDSKLLDFLPYPYNGGSDQSAAENPA